MKIHHIRSLRAIVLPALKKLNRDVEIRHHWTNDQMKLNLFRHKGYWYHGKNREMAEMKAFSSLIGLGDNVIEVGGHIGYLSLYFSQRVGDSGSVTVFEPGSNNLPYLHFNVSAKKNVRVIEAACGGETGRFEIFEDDLTGQNNSLLKSFEGLDSNARNAVGIKLKLHSRLIDVVRLDELLNNFRVDFIKIDVEGFEYPVLLGADSLLDKFGQKPIFMIEVQRDHEAIKDWLVVRGYVIFNNYGQAIDSIPHGVSNIFALHPDVHINQLKNWLKS